MLDDLGGGFQILPDDIRHLDATRQKPGSHAAAKQKDARDHCDDQPRERRLGLGLRTRLRLLLRSRDLKGDNRALHRFLGIIGRIHLQAKCVATWGRVPGYLQACNDLITDPSRKVTLIATINGKPIGLRRRLRCDQGADSQPLARVVADIERTGRGLACLATELLAARYYRDRRDRHSSTPWWNYSKISRTQANTNPARLAIPFSGRGEKPRVFSAVGDAEDEQRWSRRYHTTCLRVSRSETLVQPAWGWLANTTQSTKPSVHTAIQITVKVHAKGVLKTRSVFRLPGATTADVTRRGVAEAVPQLL